MYLKSVYEVIFYIYLLTAIISVPSFSLICSNSLVLRNSIRLFVDFGFVPYYVVNYNRSEVLSDGSILELFRLESCHKTDTSCVERLWCVYLLP